MPTNPTDALFVGFIVPFSSYSFIVADEHSEKIEDKCYSINQSNRACPHLRDLAIEMFVAILHILYISALFVRL